MVNLQNFDNLELIRVAKDIADQKGLNLDIIIRAIEEAIQLTSRSKYGNCKIKVTVDRKTGVVSTYRQVLVINDNGEIVIPENKKSEIDSSDISKYKLITLTEAKQIDENAEVGGVMLEHLPVIDLAYSSAKNAMQEIT